MDRRKFLSMAAAASTCGLTLSSPLLNMAMATTQDHRIRAIAFDGFPIFDPRPILAMSKELYPDLGDQFGKNWFNKIFAYSWLRTSGEHYRDFYGVLEDALNYTAQRLKVDLRPEARDQLMDVWLNLKVWPDFPMALKIFKANNIRLAFLSNLTEDMLRTNTRNNGIENDFEFYLTTDAVRAFKPDPRAYQMGVDAFQLPKQNIAFAAFGGWDAAGASWFGYPTVWVNRFGLPAERLDPDPVVNPIITGRDITTLVDFVVHKRDEL